MHRTEGDNNDNGYFIDGPPGTRVTSDWMNAVQEEIVNVILDAGLTLKTKNTDTKDQLKEALNILFGTISQPKVLFEHQVSQGADGGEIDTIYGITTEEFKKTRPITHIKYNQIPNFTIDTGNNTFKPAVGTYELEIRQSFFDADRFRTWLYNITQDQTELTSMAGGCFEQANSVSFFAPMKTDLIYFNGTDEYKIECYANQDSAAVQNFGKGGVLPGSTITIGNEIYMQAFFKRISVDDIT
jgi:hypothetical protein